MSITTTIISAIATKVLDVVRDVFGRKKLSDIEEKKLEQQIVKILSDNLIQLDRLKTQLILEDARNRDPYVRRARPTLIYGGLALVFINYSCIPFLFHMMYFFSDEKQLDPSKPVTIPIPTEFWYVWGSVCGLWVLSRGLEKMNKTGLFGTLFALKDKLSIGRDGGSKRKKKEQSGSSDEDDPLFMRELDIDTP